MASKKILVADDSLTIQKVIRLALSNEGYEIQTVSDGNDAIQQISLFNPQVVLIDVSLPGKSAFQVKQWVNEKRESDDEFKHTAFILLSSAFEKVDEPEAQRVKFDARLTKPFDPAQLRRQIQELIQRVPLDTPPIHPPQFPPTPASQEFLETPVPQTKPDNSLPPVPKSLPPIPPTPPSSVAPGLAPGQSDSDSDIRQLTESTIRMSKLDEFDWTVNEPIKTSENLAVTLPPLPPLSEFSNLPPLEPENDLDSLPPPIPSIEIEKPVAPPASFEQVTPVSTAEMEEILRRQMAESIEQMAKRLLPEIAERLLKEEIHRMLQSKP